MPSEENRPSKYLLHNLSILRDGSLPPTIRLMEESKMGQFNLLLVPAEVYKNIRSVIK